MIVIPVGTNPGELTVNETTNKIYVSNFGSDSVSVIDGATNTVIGNEISVGVQPLGIAVNEITNKIYVANLMGDSVSVIRGSDDTVIKTISSVPLATAIAVNEKTNKIYVTDRSTLGTVTVIDGDTDVIIDSISVGNNPEGIAVNETTNKIYVSNLMDNSVSVIRGSDDTVIKTILSLPTAVGVAVNETTNKIYVATDSILNPGTVSVIDGKIDAIVGSPITVESKPLSVTVNEIPNTIYVSNSDSNSVSVINGSTAMVTGSIPTLLIPIGVAVNETTNILYVANVGSNSVSVFNVTSSPEIFGNEFEGLAEGIVYNKIRAINRICGDSGLITGDVVKNLPVGSGTGFTPSGSLIPRVGIVTISGEKGYGVVVGGNKKGIYVDGFRPSSLFVDSSLKQGILAGKEDDSVRVCTKGVCLARVINATAVALEVGTSLTPDIGGTTSIDNFGTFRKAETGDFVLARLLQLVPAGTEGDTRLRIVAVNVQREGII